MAVQSVQTAEEGSDLADLRTKVTHSRPSFFRDTAAVLSPC